VAKRKKVWKRKTFWTGLSLVGFGVALCISKKWEEGVQAVIGGLGLIFLRSAVEKNQLDD
jgi:hypothetical protein